MEVKIHESWKRVLEVEFEKQYFADIKDKLIKERSAYAVYPPANLIFNAFDTTPFENVKVVLLGQDPYHGVGQAMGLSFSVPVGVSLPPSLKNIYKELHDDIGIEQPVNGNLTSWAKQGILLLNAVLTVRANQPASHQMIGWQLFTDAVIKMISDKKEHVVFLLRGNFAKSKKSLIDTTKHIVLEAAHPSPFSAHSGFFGCKHFSKTNTYLTQHGEQPIIRDIQ